MFIISDDLKVFLLNLSVTFALLFYFTYIANKREFLSSRWIIGVVCSFAIIICMIFPVYPVPGFTIDMRLIPFVIGSLYGGRSIAVLLLLTLLLFRYLIGDDAGFYSVLATYPFLTLCLMYLIPRFQNTSKFKEKAYIAVAPTTLGIIFLIGFLFNGGLKLNGVSSLILVPLYLTQILGIFFFVYLIERKRSELYLLDEIKKLEKLKIVSDIAASISHEVRNPLTVTRGFLQLLKDTSITNEKREMYIRLSIEELDRASTTITEYLTFAKPSLKNIELLHLNNELKYVKEIVNPYAQLHNVNINFTNNEPMFIAGEKQKLHQCLLNIMKNGIESMPTSGQLSINLERKDNYALVKIKDNGIGMTKQQIDRLGTPYYSTKEKGTGLGIMTVYSIVKLMKGNVIVDSKVGEGTCFTLEFPLKKIK